MYKNTFGPAPNAPLSLSIKSLYRDFICIGGPCSVENEDQIAAIFEKIHPYVTHFRGGVFRAGTYPSKNFGWQWELLKSYHSIAQQHGKPNVVDVLDVRSLEDIEPYCDVFQVGMRQSQHYVLLEELGKQRKPVILKRGSWQKLSEFLGSLEYILKGGNENVILCERGGVTFLDHVRWDLSISLIAKLKLLTSFPVIVDASHGTGDRKLVRPMTLAGIAAGADGCLLETHYDPDSSLSDSEQAVSLNEFEEIVSECLKLRKILS